MSALSLSESSPSVCVLPSFCAIHVFVCRCGVVQGMQYVVCLRLNVYIFMDHVKRSVHTLVGEIQCYRNDSSSSSSSSSLSSSSSSSCLHGCRLCRKMIMFIKAVCGLNEYCRLCLHPDMTS